MEGPSDVAALAMLAGDRGPHRLRFEPLREADALRERTLVNALRTIARGFATAGFGALPVLCLDADKRAKMEAEWNKWSQNEDPNKTFRVIWLGKHGHDLESCFVELEFLSEYFRGRFEDRTLSDAAISNIEQIVKTVNGGHTPNRHSEKASQLLAALHESLLGDGDVSTSKEDYLVNLAAFYLAHANAGWAASVRKNLAGFLDAL